MDGTTTWWGLLGGYNAETTECIGCLDKYSYFNNNRWFKLVMLGGGIGVFALIWAFYILGGLFQ